MMSKARRILAVLLMMMLLPVMTPELSAKKAANDEKEKKKEDIFLNHAFLEDCKLMEDALAEADAAAAAGDVERTIKRYQTALEAALEAAPSAVYLVEGGDASRTNPQAGTFGVEIYQPGLELCRSRLMKMSAADLKIYRGLFSATAAHELRKALFAQDAAILLNVGEKYAFAPAGLRALEMAGDIFSENDAASKTAYCYERMLDTFDRWPSIVSPEQYAVLLGKLAETYCKTGEEKRLRKIAGAVQGDAKLAGAKLRICGEDVKLGVYVAQRLKSLKPRVEKAVIDYPTFGGNAAGNALMSGLAGRQGGELWRYAIDDSLKKVVSRYPPGDIRKRPALISVAPIVYEGKLYINTGKFLIALDEYDGSEVFRVSVSYSSAHSNIPYGVSVMSYCTIADGVVYASTRLAGANARGVFRVLNASDGTDLGWGSDQLTRDIGKLRAGGVVAGPVTVLDGRIYAVVCKTDRGHQKKYLVCADAKTGARLWDCFLCERRTEARLGGSMYLSDYIVIKDDMAVVAAPDAGLVAAVNIRRGRLAWAMKYHEDMYHNLFPPRNGESFNPRVYGLSHPIIQNGRLLYAPRNTKMIYCLDMANGKARWALPAPELSYVAGVDGDELFYFDKKLNAVKISTGAKTQLTASYSDKLVGRPAMTKGSIYFSTISGAWRYDRQQKNTANVMNWQAQRAFTSNIIATESTIYMVNNEQVIALSGAGLRRKYRDLIAKNAADPVLRFKRARVHMVGRNYKDALEDLRVAAKNASDGITAFGRPLKGLVNDNLAVCCWELMDRHYIYRKYDEALEYAELSLKHSRSPSITAQVLLLIAKIYEEKGVEHFGKAFETYSRVLVAEDAMIAMRGTLKISSHFQATARMTELMKKHGRSAYLAEEAKAAVVLAAIDAGTPEKNYDRRRLIAEYPNSLAGLKGLTWIVRDSEKRGDASLALIWCKIAMRNYEDHPDLAPVLEIAQRLAWSFGEGYIARYTLERLGGISGAVVSDGRSAAEFVAARLAEVNQQSSIAKGKGVLDPDAKLMHKIKLDNFGLNKNGKKVISSPYFYQNIIMPVMGRRPECMVGKTLIRRGAMVECYDLTTGAELWYNSMTRGWLGFSLCRDTNDIMHQMSDEAIEKGLVNAHEILSVAGHPIARYSDVEEAVKDKAFGEQVEVVYRPRDPNNFHKRLPPKTITLTYTKPPAVLTAEISWALYSGETVVICAKALHNNLMGCEPSRIYCIDLKTGKTLWTKNGQSSVRRMQHSSFLASNNLVPFVTRSAEGRLVKFVDCADGSTRLVCKVRGEGKFAHVLHVGDSITTIFGRKRVCETYDVLTGRLRMSMTLGQGADGEFKIAGERLLTLRDNGGATRVIDMFNGKEIFNKSLGRGSQAIRSKALGRYMVISRTDRNKSVVLFDGLTATYTKIDLDYYFKQVLMQDDSVLFWTFGNIALYDIKTGKALWKKPAYGMSSMYSKAQGRYLRSINLSYQSKPTGQKSPNGRHDIRQYFAKIQIYVINMQTGEPIFDRRMTHPGRVERSCEIIDGRVCLVLSQYLYIYDKPPVKK